MDNDYKLKKEKKKNTICVWGKMWNNALEYIHKLWIDCVATRTTRNFKGKSIATELIFAQSNISHHNIAKIIQNR